MQNQACTGPPWPLSMTWSRRQNCTHTLLSSHWINEGHTLLLLLLLHLLLLVGHGQVTMVVMGLMADVQKVRAGLAPHLLPPDK